MTRPKYWWISVAGANYEPGVVKGRQCFTFGCADAFDLDASDCPVKLIEEIDALLTPKQEARHWRHERSKIPVSHGYRNDLRG